MAELPIAQIYEEIRYKKRMIAYHRKDAETHRKNAKTADAVADMEEQDIIELEAELSRREGR